MICNVCGSLRLEGCSFWTSQANLCGWFCQGGSCSRSCLHNSSSFSRAYVCWVYLFFDLVDLQYLLFQEVCFIQEPLEASPSRIIYLVSVHQLTPQLWAAGSSSSTRSDRSSVTWSEQGCGSKPSNGCGSKKGTQKKPLVKGKIDQNLRFSGVFFLTQSQIPLWTPNVSLSKRQLSMVYPSGFDLEAKSSRAPSTWDPSAATTWKILYVFLFERKDIRKGLSASTSLSPKLFQRFLCMSRSF